MNYRYIIIICLAMLIGACQEKKTEDQESTVDVEVKTPKEIIQVLDAAIYLDEITTKTDIQLLDVRTPEEFAEGHLKGAINYSVTGSDFQEQITQLDVNKPVYLYCRSGGRSARASEKMKQFGFTEIRDLKGGITAWNDAQLPIEN